MTTSYGSAGRVLSLLGLTTDDLTIADAEVYVNEAIRDIKSQTYEQGMLDTFFATSIQNSGATNRVYNTYYPIKDDSQASLLVYVRGVLLTQNTEYTYDLAASEITISTSVSLDAYDTISIYYIPSFFDDYANILACMFITETKLVNLSASNSGDTIYTRLEKRVERFKSMIKNKPRLARFKDHLEEGGVW
jgi:hypothetical protein